MSSFSICTFIMMSALHQFGIIILISLDTLSKENKITKKFFIKYKLLIKENNVLIHKTQY